MNLVRFAIPLLGTRRPKEGFNESRPNRFFSDQHYLPHKQFRHASTATKAINVSVLYMLGSVSMQRFAQLTYRESLRDIECCLRAFASKLYHMGIGSCLRTTLPMRMKTEIGIFTATRPHSYPTGRTLCKQDDLVELDQTVYASMLPQSIYVFLFPWANFRSAKAAVNSRS